MACGYRFNGNEFSSKEQLAKYIQDNIDEIPSNVILELLDTASENALLAETEAKLFSGSEFTNISDRGLASIVEPITYEYVKAIMDKERNSKLNNIAPRLTDFANKLGVSVDFIKADGIGGVARIADGIIAISIGEDLTDSYYEEMSHTLREKFKDRLSNGDLSDFVKSTPEYAKYADEYRIVYQSEGIKNENLERKVELEIFDKILSSELKRELNKEEVYDDKKGGLWDTIRNWVIEFVDWIRNSGHKDARNMIRDIIYAVNTQDVSQFSNKQFEFQSYYRLNTDISPEIKSVSNDLIANLKNAMASIRSIYGSDAVVNTVENQIYGFGDGDGVATNKMLDSFISSTARLIDDANREVELLASSDSIMTKRDLALIGFFVNKVPEALPLTKKSIENGKLVGVKSEREKFIMAKKVDELDGNIKKLKEQYDKYALEFILKRMEEGHNLIGTSEKTLDAMKSSFQDGVAKDIGWIQRWLFSGYTSSSAIDALFHKLRHTMKQDYENNTKNNVSAIAEKLSKLNVSFEEFNSLIDKGKDGKATGYIVSPYMRDVIDDILIEKISSEIDAKILDKSTIESIINRSTKLSELTEAQRELYQYALSKANIDMTEKPFLDEYYQIKEKETETNIRSVFPNKTDDEVRKLKKAIAVKTTPLYSKKATILARYKSRDSILNMSHGDILEIDSIDAQIKFLSQTYNELGGEKDGELAEIAQVLKFSLDNYKAQEDENQYIKEYSEYLDEIAKNNLDVYQVMKRTGSIIFNEEDSINTVLHELGTYEVYEDSAVLQMINAYLPDNKKLIITTPSQKDGVKQKLTQQENDNVKMAISTLKEIRKSMLSPYKKFGEIRVGASGLSDVTLSEVEKLEKIFRIVKNSQKLSEEEKAITNNQEIGFIATDHFYSEYGYVDVNSIDEIASSSIKIDGGESARTLTYVLTSQGGIQQYYKRDSNGNISKFQPTSVELSRKEAFERKHMEPLAKSGKLEPKFYFKKVVNERKIESFSGNNPVFEVGNPEEKALYISKTNGKHYKYSKQEGTFYEVSPPDKNKGERYVTFGGKTFLVQIKPNSIWKGKSESSKYVNPNYNDKIGKKTAQYKKIINVNGRPVSTLNNTYFTKFGISKDNIWGDATINKNLWDAMGIVMDNDQLLLRNIGVEQDYYLRPQVRITPDEILYAKGGIQNSAKAWLSRNILSNIQDVDDMSSVNSDKKLSLKEGKQRNQLLDNYNIKIDTDELTNNLLASYYTRSEMAIRYNERAKNLVAADMLLNTAKEIEYSIDEFNTKKGEESIVLASMKDNYVADFFGALQIELGTMNVMGKRVSGTKTIQTLRRYLTGKALGFNKYTGVSSAISGWVAKHKESFIGRYGTREDYKFVSETVSYMDMAKDFGNKITSEKILRVAEFMGIVDFKDIMARANRHESINKITSLADPFSFLRLGDMPRIAESVVIGLLQFRKIDGKWYSRDSFLEKTVNNEKKSMTDADAIWDANQKNALYHEVMKYYKEDNKTLKITDKEIKTLFDSASYIGQKHHTDLTGNIKGVDSANAFRHPFTSAIGMFKNFFINNLQNRFHEEIPDQYTGGVRKGSYRYVQLNKEWAKLLAYAVMNLHSKINDPNNGLTYQEMQSLRRIQLDIYASLSFLVIAMLLRGLADDDEYEDVWAVQAAAHAAAKIFSEVSSGDIYSLPTQGLDIMASPYKSFVSFGKDVKGLTFGGEDVEQGNYKGFSKRSASAMKLAPLGLSNIYNIIGDDAEMSRNYLYKEGWVWDVYEKINEE